MSLSATPRGPGRARGFTLVEVLITLTVLGVALLLGMELVLQNPRIVRRVDGERQAFRAMETALEAVRAGVIPLESGPIPNDFVPVGFPEPQDLRLAMDVTPTTPAGLYEVTVTAQYKVFNHKHKKQLETMVWISP